MTNCCLLANLIASCCNFANFAVAMTMYLLFHLTNINTSPHPPSPVSLLHKTHICLYCAYICLNTTTDIQIKPWKDKEITEKKMETEILTVYSLC